MPTLPNRLRQAAQYVWQGELYDLLIEAAGALESAGPVAWRYQDARGHFRYRGYVHGFDKEYAILKPVPLYTAPQPQERKPLTYENADIPEDLSKVSFVATVHGENFAEAVERACRSFHITWDTMSESRKEHSRRNMALALLAALRKD